jgi:dTDP-glucose pyrophosphorylase
MNSTKEKWRSAVLSEGSTIQEAIENLNKVAIKIILVNKRDGKFLGTVSDGDIRRGLLKGLTLTSAIDDIVQHKPLIVPPSIDQNMIRQLMISNKIHQIPVLDAKHRVIGLHLWDEINNPFTRKNSMVIMAGGRGVRLMPHTEKCPKPMVLVGGKPMLEHVIDRGKQEGFAHFILAIHHLGHVIESYFGNGERFGVKIDYLREQSPLGTAGALALLDPRPDLPFVVTNCDVITEIRYGEILDFHCQHGALATMAVRLHEWQHPFGVVCMDGLEIVGFEEKPVARSHINAGIYVLSPDSLDELVKDTPCDMPVLFTRLHAEESRTIAYPMHESWLDVGRPGDLILANRESSQPQMNIDYTND